MVKDLEEAKRLAYEIACCRCQYYIDNKCTNESECAWKTIKEDLEVLLIIYNSPFIIDNLVELGKLPPEAKQRYLFGTITNRDVQKVEEFFKNGEMRDQSK